MVFKQNTRKIRMVKNECACIDHPAFWLDHFLNDINEYTARRNTATDGLSRRGGWWSIWFRFEISFAFPNVPNLWVIRRKKRVRAREKAVGPPSIIWRHEHVYVVISSRISWFIRPKRMNQISRTSALSTLRTREISIL